MLIPNYPYYSDALWLSVAYIVKAAGVPSMQAKAVGNRRETSSYWLGQTPGLVVIQ